MLITLLCFLGLVVGIIGFQIFKHSSYDKEVGFAVMSVISGVAIGFCLVGIVLAPIEINGKMANYNALQESLSLARANQDVSPYEIAAIQQQVIQFNRELAEKQYWAKNIWTSWFYSKRIFEMNPIR